MTPSRNDRHEQITTAVEVTCANFWGVSDEDPLGGRGRKKSYRIGAIVVSSWLKLDVGAECESGGGTLDDKGNENGGKHGRRRSRTPTQ